MKKNLFVLACVLGLLSSGLADASVICSISFDATNVDGAQFQSVAPAGAKIGVTTASAGGTDCRVAYVQDQTTGEIVSVVAGNRDSKVVSVASAYFSGTAVLAKRLGQYQGFIPPTDLRITN